MKATIFSVIFSLIFVLSMQAQELYIDGGKSVTNFKFRDVLAEELQDLQSTNHSYVDVGYRGKLLTKAINFVGGFGFHTYGARGNNNFQEFLEWEATYAAIYAGIDVEVFTLGDFAFHVRGTAGPEIMLQGTQTRNNLVFDILNEEDFDTAFIFLRGSALLEYSVSENAALLFTYRFGRGSQINNSATGADLQYTSNDFGIGIVYRLKSKKNKENKNTSADAKK
ncbi:MAG: hypothetical protein AAFP76_13925 [Bacteroidota bacterium]